MGSFGPHLRAELGTDGLILEVDAVALFAHRVETEQLGEIDLLYV
jgi:hypothetical protein